MYVHMRKALIMPYASGLILEMFRETWHQILCSRAAEASVQPAKIMTTVVVTVPW